MGDGGLSTAGGSAKLHVRGRADRARTLYFIAAAVLAALVPPIVFAGLWVRTLLSQSERDLQAHLSSRATSLSARLDAEVQEEFSVLRAIASLPSLDEPDLIPFEATARRMVAAIPQWSLLALIDVETGRQVFGTQDPTAANPVWEAPDTARQVAEQRQPKVVTRLAGAQTAARQDAVLLYLPVVRDAGVRHVLVAGMKPETVQNLLLLSQEPNLLTVVVDEQDRILARSRGREEFFGRSANDQLREAIRNRSAGLFVADTLDGQRVVTVFRKSPMTGWASVAAADREQVDVASEQSRWALVGTGALSLTLASALAVFLFYNVVERRVSDERLAASRALGELDARLLTTTQDALLEQRKAASEREVLLREIYHRVKNNLQIIQSLLQLGSRNLNPEQREPFEGAIRRIGAMARVHTLLYKSPDLASIDFKEYLEDLVRETGEGFGADVRGIRTKLEAERMRIPLDTAVPLAFITVEILTNAFKHAFPDRRQGEIVILSRQEDGRGILVIEDNGAGLPAAQSSPKRSLGLTLVRKLVEQIGGELEAPAPGQSRYTVTFPLVPHQQATVLPPAPGRS